MNDTDSQRLVLKKWTFPRGIFMVGNGVLLRDCVLLFLGGLILSAARIHGQALPLAACLIAAFPLGLRTIAAAVGAVLGYFLFCDGVDCAGLIVLSVLTLATLAVFQGTQLLTKSWFLPLMMLGMCAILKGIELPGGGSLRAWVLHFTLGGVFCAVFRGAVAVNSRARLLAAAACVCGLYALPLGINLGLIAAVALCVATAKLSLPIALGLAMDLYGTGGCNTIALLLPAVVGQQLYPRAKNLYSLAYLVLPVGVFFLCGQWSAGQTVAVGLGVALGMVLERGRVLPRQVENGSREAAVKLGQAAHVMEILRRQLPSKAVPACIGEAESVYDGAAERICRCCARFHRCWQHRAEETYEALSGAARRIIERGTAQVEDFPQEFRNRCCHMEGFVTAVNQELEGMLYRRRYRMQLQESRQVVAQQMECMVEYLQAMGEARGPSYKKRAAYLPRVGICSIGKNGSRISGDRGACFAGVGTDYFVLLCDGMGTGTRANRLSGETVSLLEQLLKSGLAPESVLKLLNGVELLRGDDRFTTVDLLHLDLKNGRSVLYKWGSAPSYLRDEKGVKKIGTASPPPGVGVGGEHVPERYELSLKEGEMLVLASDGAGGEETQTAISAYSGESPQELAALLISGRTAEDDMTAVAVSLQLYVS